MSEVVGDAEFARAFGALLRRHITRQAMTYDQVAHAVWGESGNKGNVSAYVNGRKGRPTARTIAAFRDALTIPQAEIDALLDPPKPADDALVRRLEESARDTARGFHIKEGMLIALARRYAEGTPDDFDAALAGLERALEVAHEEAEKARLPSNVSDAVTAIIARVDALNEAGDLDAGSAALDAEFEALDAARARLCDKGVAQARLARDAEAACRYALARFDLDAPQDAEGRQQALRKLCEEWYVAGRDKGLNFELEVAILLARASLARADTPDRRGTSGNDLGNALWTLGERESGTARLEEALAAYRAALEERRREQSPLDWAATQNDLGAALYVLGERESGTARLEEAAAAYRAALEERRRDRVPLDWAGTQSNLGNALYMLGARGSGTARLEDAVAAYRAALEERRRDRVPLDWAMTQSNLGAALQTIGSRETGTARLEEAVAAYRAALEERRRDRVPLGWAATQNNLGFALATLGARESGTARLEEAVAAYRAALEEWRRDRVPLDWATSWGSQGATLVLLAERTEDANMLARAATQLEEAAAVFREAGHAPNLAYYEQELAKARALQAKLPPPAPDAP